MIQPVFCTTLWQRLRSDSVVLTHHVSKTGRDGLHGSVCFAAATAVRSLVRSTGHRTLGAGVSKVARRSKYFTHSNIGKVENLSLQDKHPAQAHALRKVGGRTEFGHGEASGTVELGNLFRNRLDGGDFWRPPSSLVALAETSSARAASTAPCPSTLTTFDFTRQQTLEHNSPTWPAHPSSPPSPLPVQRRRSPFPPSFFRRKGQLARRPLLPVPPRRSRRHGPHRRSQGTSTVSCSSAVADPSRSPSVCPSVVVAARKFACQSCIKGHRSTKVSHTSSGTEVSSPADCPCSRCSVLIQRVPLSRSRVCTPCLIATSGRADSLGHRLLAQQRKVDQLHNALTVETCVGLAPSTAVAIVLLATSKVSEPRPTRTCRSRGTGLRRARPR